MSAMIPTMERIRLLYAVVLLLFSAFVVIKIIAYPCSFLQPNQLTVYSGAPCDGRHLRLRKSMALVDHHDSPLENQSFAALPPRLLQYSDESTVEPATADTVRGQALPAAMLLGVASFIILCSLAQYVSDWRYRYQHTHSIGRQDQEDPEQKVGEEKPKETKSETAATCVVSRSKGSKSDRQDIHRPVVIDVAESDLGIFDSQSLRDLPLILPPLAPDPDESDAMVPYQDCSISRVSTMTNSVVDGALSFGDCIEERFLGHCEQGTTNYDVDIGRMWGADVMELSSLHRVPQERSISLLTVAAYERREALALCQTAESVDDISHTDPSQAEAKEDNMGDEIEKVDDDEALVSPCSSVTNGSKEEDTENSSRLHGEGCLKDEKVSLEGEEDCPKTEDLTLKKQSSGPDSSLSLELSPDGPDKDSFVSRDIAFVGKLLFGEEENESINEAEELQRVRLGQKDSRFQELVGRESPRDEHLLTLPASISMEDIDPMPTEEEFDPMAAEHFIREIFFVPVSSHLSDKAGTETLQAQNGEIRILGLRLIDASCAVTHPCIKEVWSSSPLVGRVFEGDFFLKLNGADVTGLTAGEVVELLLAVGKQDDGESCTTDMEEGSEGGLIYQMIKLTIMSSHSDGGSAFDDDETYNEDDDIDVGLADTGVEF